MRAEALFFFFMNEATETVYRLVLDYCCERLQRYIRVNGYTFREQSAIRFAVRELLNRLEMPDDPNPLEIVCRFHSMLECLGREQAVKGNNLLANMLLSASEVILDISDYVAN